MCISKILTDLCLTKQRIKTKSNFARVFLHCFSSKNVLTEHKDICLSINGAQSLSKKRNNWVQKLFQTNASSIFVYANSDHNLESVKSYEASYSKKYEDCILSSFAYKLVCVDDRFSKPIVVFKVTNAAYKFIEPILKEYQYCKKVINRHFNKNWTMSEEEEQFQSSNICWMWKKLTDHDDKKFRDLCHII